MRSMSIHIGVEKRNDPYELVDLNPLPRYPSDIYSGNPAVDGYTLIARTTPERQGSPPDAGKTIGRIYRGSDSSFEQ